MDLVHDYRAWKALGPGGLPANPLGWAVTTALRPLTRDPLDPRPRGAGTGGTPPAGAWEVPARGGARPSIGRHPIPHRQLDQIPPAHVRRRTEDAVRSLGHAGGPALRLARSRLERRGEALFAADPGSAAGWLRAVRGEIAHVHASDGSLHVTLHPADAATLIRSARGERHPLCGVPLLGLPHGYLLLYAPRDEDELDVARAAIGRAAAWAGTGP